MPNSLRKGVNTSLMGNVLKYLQILGRPQLFAENLQLILCMWHSCCCCCFIGGDSDVTKVPSNRKTRSTVVDRRRSESALSQPLICDDTAELSSADVEAPITTTFTRVRYKRWILFGYYELHSLI